MNWYPKTMKNFCVLAVMFSAGSEAGFVVCFLSLFTTDLESICISPNALKGNRKTECEIRISNI